MLKFGGKIAPMEGALKKQLFHFHGGVVSFNCKLCCSFFTSRPFDNLKIDSAGDELITQFALITFMFIT